MYERALKCENNAIFKQTYSLELFIAFKMANSCCFSVGENLYFLDFLKKVLKHRLLLEKFSSFLQKL